MQRLITLIVILVAFTAYSTWVTLTKGYTGFLTLAWAEPWGMQILLDLCIALTLAWGGLRRDARAVGINPWPYLIATPFIGSISPLAYMVHRQWRKLQKEAVDV